MINIDENTSEEILSEKYKELKKLTDQLTQEKNKSELKLKNIRSTHQKEYHSQEDLLIAKDYFRKWFSETLSAEGLAFFEIKSFEMSGPQIPTKGIPLRKKEELKISAKVQLSDKELSIWMTLTPGVYGNTFEISENYKIYSFDSEALDLSNRIIEIKKSIEENNHAQYVVGQILEYQARKKVLLKEIEKLPFSSKHDPRCITCGYDLCMCDQQ